MYDLIKSKIKYEFSNLNNLRKPLSSEERGKQTFKKFDYYGASGIIDKVDDYLFSEPLILVGEDGANLLSRSTPLAFKAEGKYWVNNHAHILKPKDDLIDFWCFLLESLDYVPYVTGSAQPKLTQENLSNIIVHVPNYSNKKLIELFLKKRINEIDLLLSSKEKQIKLLEEQRQAMIIEAVTKGLNPNVKMKDSEVEWIGEIPEHWKVSSLKRVLTIRNGKEIDSDSEVEESESSIPVYGSGGIFKWTNRKLYSGDSILFGRKGTIGKPIRVNGDFWTVDTMYYSIPKIKESSGYLFYLLCIYPWRLISTNTAVPSIVGTELGEQKICFPNSKQELRSIEIFLKNKDYEIKRLVSRIELQLVKLKEYRQSLIHEAVTGKIPIEEMEAYIKEAEKNGD
ncbi:TPA: restriction endonuclease subunit S [Enterococcus faecalis]